jgi:methyl-accepting chemotaxis protein
MAEHFLSALFGTGDAGRRAAAATQQLDAIGRMHGLAEVAADGRLLSANDAFLGSLGEAREAAVGRPLTALLAEGERDSPAWRQLWDRLGRGEAAAARLR